MTVSLLDHRGSVIKTLHTDAHDPDRMVEVTVQDLDPLLEQVRRDRETHVQGKEMKLAAWIPMEVVERMMREGSWNDPAAIKRWANDPQNECFRVWKGRL